MGVMHPSPQSVYAVFGTKADVLKNRIREELEKHEASDKKA
jgi:phosphotransferase system IIB component